MTESVGFTTNELAAEARALVKRQEDAQAAIDEAFAEWDAAGRPHAHQYADDFLEWDRERVLPLKSENYDASHARSRRSWTIVPEMADEIERLQQANSYLANAVLLLQTEPANV